MSGIDEQEVFCACGRADTPYWEVKHKTGVIGYINSNTWIKKHRLLCAGKHLSFFRWCHDKEISEILKIIDNFCCNHCERIVTKEHAMFPRLMNMLRNYYLQEGTYKVG